MACQLCQNAEEPVSVVYHAGERVRVYECDTCGAPLVVASDHTADPGTDTEQYALGVARGLFGPAVAFREAGHGMPAGHWAAHVDVGAG